MKTFERRYATRFAFGVFKPALKRGPMLDCRHCGKVKPAIGKALGRKRGSSFDCRYHGRSIRRCVKSRLLKTFERRYATRFAFGVFKPALKRGPTFNCRYRGKVKSVIGKALDWKRGPTLDCRYCGKVKPAIGKALNWKRAPTFDCRYRGRSGSRRKSSVAVLMDEIQCF